MTPLKKTALPIIFAIIFVLLIPDSCAMIINEFMPDPDDNSSDRSEWIEIAIEDQADIEDMAIDSGEGHMKINGSFGPNEHIILTKNASVFLSIWGNFNASVFEDNKMSLSNTADNITLYNASVPIQRVEYSKPTKNVSYGLCDGILVKQNLSTPGHANVCASEPLNDTNETEYPSSCNVSLYIDSPLFFLPEEKQNYYIIVNDHNCTEKAVVIEYWIEDMFGKNVKSKYNTTQSIACHKNISREWTAHEMFGTEVYQIKAMITRVECNDSDISDNYAEKIIVIKGYEYKPDSEIKISDVDTGSDLKAKFGDIINVDMNVYKGNTSKTSMNIWAENPAGDRIAKVSLNIYDRFTNCSFSIPLQLNPNCDGTFPDGTYIVKADGIDSYDEAEILVSGNSTSLCKTKTVEKQKPCSCQPCQACKCENKTTGDAAKDAAGKKTGKSESLEIKNYFFNQTNAIKNTTESTNKNATQNKSSIKSPTGKMIAANDESWFSGAINNVINFFKNLFKL